jgi:hypothetical protein
VTKSIHYLKLIIILKIQLQPSYQPLSDARPVFVIVINMLLLQASTSYLGTNENH